jgi:hypothetical protein
MPLLQMSTNNSILSRSMPPYRDELSTDDALHDDELQEIPKTKSLYQTRKAAALVIALLFVFTLVKLVEEYFRASRTNVPKPASTASDEPCLKPSIRMEWRGLSRSEQHEYLMAVTCLHQLPSITGMSGYHSDDFPWAHQQVEYSGDLTSSKLTLPAVLTYR